MRVNEFPPDGWGCDVRAVIGATLIFKIHTGGFAPGLVIHCSNTELSYQDDKDYTTSDPLPPTYFALSTVFGALSVTPHHVSALSAPRSSKTFILVQSEPRKVIAAQGIHTLLIWLRTMVVKEHHVLFMKWLQWSKQFANAFENYRK